MAPTHLSLSRRRPIKDVLADWTRQGGRVERGEKEQQMADSWFDFGLISGIARVSRGATVVPVFVWPGLCTDFHQPTRAALIAHPFPPSSEPLRSLPTAIDSDSHAHYTQNYYSCLGRCAANRIGGWRVALDTHPLRFSPHSAGRSHAPSPASSRLGKSGQTDRHERATGPQRKETE